MGQLVVSHSLCDDDAFVSFFRWLADRAPSRATLVEIDFAVGAGVKYCGVVLDVRVLVPGHFWKCVVRFQNGKCLAEEGQRLLLDQLAARGL